MHEELARALSSLGRAGLGLSAAAATHDARRLGEYTLLPHQSEAVERLRPMLATHGGALLADAVGLGKTLVALTLSLEHPSTCVIAPAALVPMWRDTARRAAANVHVRSLHKFSTANTGNQESGARTAVAPKLVIIDEAHHLRNPFTRRYAGVAEICRGAKVLLLSATPIHNRSSDLAHMLALFLGQAAVSLPLDHLYQYVIRRDEQHSSPRPRVVAHPTIPVGDNAEITRALAQLPPPVPTRDGTAAGALVNLGLVRAWCSSSAACLAAVQRRRARALALDGILAEGRWPSHAELRAWTVTEDTIQLGFTSMLVSRSEQVTPAALIDARAQLTRHRAALESLEHLLRATGAVIDRARGNALRRVRRAHGGVTIIAFSQYADTVRAIGRVLQWDAGVATLTSRGGRIASGPLSRRELLQRVAPRAHGVSAPPAHERVYLLLTTDLLAEGVNLQDAGVVVHLDWPWTPAAIAQREGRVARLGSAFREVHAYAVSPPGGGTALLRLAERLRVKARAASVVLASDAAPRQPRRLMALPSGSSALERTFRRWVALSAPTYDQSHPRSNRDDCGDTDRVVPVVHAGHSTTIVVLHHARAGWLASHQSQLMGGWFVGTRTRALRQRKGLAKLVQTIDQASEHVGVTGCYAQHPTTAVLQRIESLSDVPSEHAHTRSRISAHLAAVHRALRREVERAERHTLVPTLQSPVHRAQRHIRNILAGATLQERLRLRPLASAASHSVQTLRGAGDERELEALLKNAPAKAPADEWLKLLVQLSRNTDGSEGVSPSAANPGATSAPEVIMLALPD